MRKYSTLPHASVLAAALALASSLVSELQAQVMTSGGLGNFDVRYVPGTNPQGETVLPNDIDVYIYGTFGDANRDGTFNPEGDVVISTWNTDFLLGGVGLEWGRATVVHEGVSTDPNSPGFGLDCIRVRWEGGTREDLINKMVHLGVHLRPGVVADHWDVWWTYNGTRVQNACDPHVTWICYTEWVTICVANPTPAPIYVYGLRYFRIPPSAPLPTLNDLTFGIRPTEFGANGWNPIPLPAPPGQFTRLYCIPPWCRSYFRIPVRNWDPIIFQLAVRNISEDQGPLVGDPGIPDPDDWDSGEGGTVVVHTARAAQGLLGDINNDGTVGLPDFNLLRPAFGVTSPDVLPPPDQVEVE